MKNYKPGWLFHLRSKTVIVSFLLIASGLIYKCGTVLYMPAAPDAERVGITLDSLMKGRTLYINNCSSCHNLYSPERFSATEWEKNVNEMQKKAKISDTQKETMLKYLKSRCRN